MLLLLLLLLLLMMMMMMICNYCEVTCALYLLVCSICTCLAVGRSGSSHKGWLGCAGGLLAAAAAAAAPASTRTIMQQHHIRVEHAAA